MKTHLRFDVPAIQPGRYAFVLFAALRGRHQRGFLIADTEGPRQLLQILPSEAPSDSDDGDDVTWWVVGGIAAIVLGTGAVLLLRRRRAA